jgi:hypothetical protein
VSVKRAVIERDGGFCLLALPGCLGEAQTTDHRANRGGGGSRVLNDPRNLIAACTICNGLKADAGQIVLFDLEERGLYVRKAATNQDTLRHVIDTPVTYLDGERYWLVDATTRRHVTEGRT